MLHDGSKAGRAHAFLEYQGLSGQGYLNVEAFLLSEGGISMGEPHHSLCICYAQLTFFETLVPSTHSLRATTYIEENLQHE